MRGILSAAVVVYVWMLAITSGVALVKGDLMQWGYGRVQSLAMFISYSQVLNTALFAASLFISARMTYRTMGNIYKLKGADGQKAAAWSIAWYVVPFANLVMPPRAVHQIWVGTFGEGQDAKRRAGAIWVWWACGIISVVLHQIALRLTMADPTQRSLGDFLHPASYAFAIAGTIIFLRVFQRIARGQSLLIERAAGTPA